MLLPRGFSGIARPLLSGAAGQRAGRALGGFLGRDTGGPAPRRGFRGTPRLQEAPGDTGSADRITIHFINRDGEKLSATAKEGESLLEVVVNQNLSIGGFGACEGALACSTCHLLFDDSTFQQLGPVTAEELDMLDLAYGLTDTSRLGCQVHVKKWMDGLTVQVPVEVSDIRKELEVEKQSKQ
ncbi:UNVERIFIED_CONTAM: Adrenodoxin, mitochondrial [Gekko kuhli]